MTQEIKTVFDSWVTETEARIMKNLEKRKVVGQLRLVKKITFDTQIEGDQYAVICTFERQRNFPFQEGIGQRNFPEGLKKKEIIDPLFKKRKAWARSNHEISFVRKANVFELIKGRYWNELIEKVTKIDAAFATKMVIRALEV